MNKVGIPAAADAHTKAHQQSTLRKAVARDMKGFQQVEGKPQHSRRDHAFATSGAAFGR
jgi:hypothetical protein